MVEGAAGGILLFWDKRKMDLVEVEIGSFSITCLFKNVEDGFMWAFTGVYSLVESSKHEIFWEELGSLKRGGRLAPSMRHFAKVVNELGLRDLPLHGGSFTWRGGLNGRSMSRLDKFLVSADWESKFSKAVQSTLPRLVSYHCPIFLDGEGIRPGSRPFRFEIMWLKYEGFKDRQRDWWQNMPFSGSFKFCFGFQVKGPEGYFKGLEQRGFW